MTTRHRDRERGTISIFVAIGSSMMMLFLGIVLDAGGELRAVVNADAMAQEAARVGAQQIDKVLLFEKGKYGIDATAAENAVKAYLDQDPAFQGVPVEVVWPPVPPPQPPADGSSPPPPQYTSITVHISPTYRTALLGLFGESSLTIEGTGTATLVVNGEPVKADS
ncbi:hypothetical protein ACFYNO_21150 [Kitasatospora sp. NPDC006697]|uniref:hypothetical protein n=1 Tax=Kitasatospora sp. NPDC006697 TaxID=3364020 RepID=UPI0036828E0D